MLTTIIPQRHKFQGAIISWYLVRSVFGTLARSRMNLN
jgi:hypothetical protein